jgi:hypothetical protein
MNDCKYTSSPPNNKIFWFLVKIRNKSLLNLLSERKALALAVVAQKGVRQLDVHNHLLMQSIYGVK